MVLFVVLFLGLDSISPSPGGGLCFQKVAAALSPFLRWGKQITDHEGLGLLIHSPTSPVWDFSNFPRLDLTPWGVVWLPRFGGSYLGCVECRVQMADIVGRNCSHLLGLVVWAQHPRYLQGWSKRVLSLSPTWAPEEGQGQAEKLSETLC